MDIKKIFLAGILLLSFLSNSFSQVTVSSAGTVNLCVDEGYTTLGDITISETIAGDFSDASLSPVTYIIAAPTNFEFEPGVGSVSSAGTDITFEDISVTSSEVRVIYVDAADADVNSITISGLGIRAVGSASGPLDLVRSGGTATHTDNEVGDVQQHAELQSFNPPNAGTSTNASICVSETSFDLNTTLTGEDTGGNWSTLDGVSLSGSQSEIFDPSSLSAGDYTFTYTVTSPNCNPATEEVTITVEPLPVANIISDNLCDDPISKSIDLVTDYNTSITSETDVTITWHSANPPTGGNQIGNTTSSTPTPTDGVIYYALIVDNITSCESVGELTINLDPLPTIVNQTAELCESSLGSGQADLNLTIYNSDISNNDANRSVSWYFDAALNFPVFNPSGQTVSNGDIYYAKVVNDITLCEEAADLSITVNSLPSEPTTADNINFFCTSDNPSAVQITAVAGSNLAWYEDPGLTVPLTTTAAQPTLDDLNVNNSSETSISRYVTQTDGNGCESQPLEIQIQVQEIPSISSAIANVEVCPGDLIDLTFDTNNTYDNISWSATNNASIGIPATGTSTINAIAASNSSGSDLISTVTIEASNNGCASPTVIETFDIILHPRAVIDPFLSPVQVCEDNNSFDLTTVGLTTDLAGGSFSFSGPGVSGTSFDATAVSPGVQEIEVTFTSADGCETIKDINLVEVLELPSIDPLPNIELCPTDLQAAVAFTADLAGGTFNWSATNATQIGLGSASGTGDLPSFTAATNTTGADIVSTITVDYELNGCPAATESFTITLKPTPVTTQESDINVCPGELVEIAFEANTVGETFNWSVDNTAIGVALASNGTGNISFTAADNLSAAPITATFTYDAELNSCGSDSKTFTITLLPQPVVDPISDFEVCSNDNVSINFISDVGSASYFWTNDNTATGIPATGTGNFNANVGENLGTTDLISTISVFAEKDGCTSLAETFTVTVKPKPQIDQLADIVVCPGDNISEIFFTDNSSGNSGFTWTATNSGNLGLPASSGTGSIPAFVVNNNNTLNNITSTITVTSEWNGCISDQMTFRIIIKPTPIMDNVTDVEVCGGEVVSIGFVSALVGTNFNWTNSDASIGLAASGSGDITFTANINNGVTPQVATIDVTPINDGCVGDVETFTITIKPTPVIDPISDFSICSEEEVVIPLNANLSSVNWNVINSDPSIVDGSISIVDDTIRFTSSENLSGVDKVANFTLTAENNLCSSSISFDVTQLLKPVPTSQPDAAPICSGDMVPARVLTHDIGSGTFNWEITNSSIIGDGTPATGTGNFPGFQLATNQTGEDVETFVRFFSERNGCLSEIDSFRIISNPEPVILSGDTVFCAGDFVNYSFSSNTGGGESYIWTNTSGNTSIGVNNLSGTSTDGLITPTGFTANNPDPVNDNVATFEVFSERNTCDGPIATFTITVKPDPTFNSSNDFSQEVCSNEIFTFSPQSDIAGSTFDWSLITADTSGIAGLPDSGSGDIIFTAANYTSGVRTVDYEITPILAGCIGTTEVLSVDIYPNLSFASFPTDFVVCSGEEFTYPLSLDNNPSGIVYEWVAQPNDVGAIDGSGTSLTATLNNPKTENEADSVVYEVRPRVNGTSCLGPSREVRVIVNQNAVVSVSAVEDTVCEGNNIDLSAVLSKGAIGGQWTSSGGGSFSSTTQTTTSYSPISSEFGQNVTFRFTSNDPDGPCGATFDEVTVFIDELPNAIIIGDPFPNDVICVRTAPQLLEGNATGLQTGSFSGPGVEFDGTDYFYNPVSAGVGGPYNIIYRLENENGCIDSDTIQVNVSNGIDPSFSTAAGSSKEACFNQEVSLFPLNEGGTFSGDGVQFNTAGEPFFNAANVSPGSTNLITYEIFDPISNCTSVSTDTIFVLEEPIIDIEYSNICSVENGIVLSNLTIDPNTADFIEEFSFTNVPVANYQFGDTAIFETAGSKTITVTATTELGCEFSRDFIIEVGNIEEVNFRAENISVSLPSSPDGTRFFNESILSGNNSFASFSWDFDDPSSGVENTSSEENPTHKFLSAGTYNVTLTIETLLGCVESINIPINIVPSIDQAQLPYFENFEDGQGGWFSEPFNALAANSWDFPSSASYYDTTSNSSQFWKMIFEGDAGYRSNEYSSLYGPTFDLTSLERPMLSFNMWLDVESTAAEGAVVEYSFDGLSWFVLGGDQQNLDQQELNWYNTLPTSRPIGVNNANSVAWSYNEREFWQYVAYPLDSLGDQETVTFRVTFRGNNEGISSGIAIDNFYLGERQKNVIVETFTNISAQDYNEANDLISNLRTSEINKDFININYHTAFPFPDEINSRNRLQLNSRASFYGIENSTQMIIDGTAMSALEISNDQYILRRSLLPLRDYISTSIDSLSDQNVIQINTERQIENDSIAENLRAFFIIIEKETPLQPSNLSLSNIVRRILPSIDGFALGDLQLGQTQTLSWEVNNLYSEQELAVVTVIQNLSTKEILQTTVTDVNQPKIPSTITANEIMLNNHFKIFPNPASDRIAIGFESMLNDDLNYYIFDAQGKVLRQGTILNGTKKQEMDLNGMSSGLYTILLTGENGKKQVRKFTIRDH